MNQVYLKIQNSELDELKRQKVFMCSFTHTSIPFPKCSGKLYMVPFKMFAGQSISRSCAIPKSLVFGDEHYGKQLTSCVSGPTNIQRFKMLDDPEFNTPANTNDLERQLKDFFSEVKAMIKMGKEEDAVALLQANYEAVKTQVDSGDQGIEEAALLDVIALGYMALGDLKTVGSLMNVQYKIVNELKDEEPYLDSILMHMGSMHSKLEDFEKSITFYRRSLEIMERKFGSNSSLLCTPLLGMAKVLGYDGRTTEAIKIYQRVITVLEASRGEEGEELAVPLCALGNLLIKEGKALDAEYPFNRVLKIFTRSYGEKDGRVGMAMCSLAQVKCVKGEFISYAVHFTLSAKFVKRREVNDAIDLYKTAINILNESKYMALDDKGMEKMRIDLAELLHAVGRQQEGRAMLEECLLMSEKVNGKKHPSLVPHLVNLASSYSRSKNFAEAERLLRISLQILGKNAPPGDPSITFPMLNLAVVLFNLHRYEEAERLAMDVLHLRENAFGKESVPVGEALDCLVSIQSRLERDNGESVELLKRLLKIQEKAFGPESMEVVETLKRIVHFLDKMGLKNEKIPLQKRLSVLRNKHKHMIMY
ncbi:nephrocystin-3 [Dorcoceras hygrometricum]|uniref:Nephrocystin-3 n=1 Tax=Dorcoceras hygrometricum TaxID=472368 RepID=A0A2Z7CHA2_9LAMI|nr:nephrocystin-3 [Dorcoceras hygrometricum]